MSGIAHRNNFSRPPAGRPDACARPENHPGAPCLYPNCECDYGPGIEDPECGCRGRGWFSMDMMGTSFYPCNVCRTHEQCEDGIHVRKIGEKV